MSLLAGGSVLLLSLLLIHAVVAPAMHGAAHWLYRGRPPARPDRRRARTAFLLLGLPPLVVGVLGASGMLHLAEGQGAWAGLLDACHRFHEHCDMLLSGGTEAVIYGGVVAALATWIGRAGWHSLAPLVQLRLRGSAVLSVEERRKLAGARRAVGHASGVRVVTAPAGLAVSAGLLRPLILVSRDVVARLSQPELAAVLAHEAAHASHFDGLRTLAVRFASALSPISGSCHIEEAYELDREILCDAEAVRRGTDPLTLATALIAMARAQVAPLAAAAPAILGHHDPERSLRTRIGLLLQAADAVPADPPERRSQLVFAVVLGIAVVVPHAAFGAIVLVHCGVETLVHLLA